MSILSMMVGFKVKNLCTTDERKRETKRRNELDVCLALLRYDLRLVFYTKLRAWYKYVH